jgi:1-acyl-sn-glycerol-3-phosphate acyltransferase
MGVKVKLEGEFDQSAQLLILNHQSILDIISVESIHPQNLCWVSKKEITEYFYFGHINKAPRMISVDREDKAGLVKLFADVKDRLSTDRPIVIFPEGTRGRRPELLQFKPGAKMIAEKLGLRVQPIIVVDSAAFLNSKHFSLNGTGKLRLGGLTIVALPSFVPQKGSAWFEETREKIQGVLNEKRSQFICNA